MKCLITTALGALLILGCSPSDDLLGIPDADDATELSAGAVSQTGALLAEKEALTPAQRISSASAARPSVFLAIASVEAVSADSDVVMPGRVATLSVELANQGGATARRVRARVATSSPFVTILSGRSAYPALGPGASAANTTELSFQVSGDLPCGAKLRFTLSVSFDGRGTNPAVIPFTILTGRPGTGAITVSYDGAPVAIPDADPAGVDIPLAVSSVNEISRLLFRIDGEDCTSAEGATSVGVDHTRVGDLVFRLTSPGGSTVTLIDRAGGARNGGNNFCQTALDDNAIDSIQDVSVSEAPFTGTFTPATPARPFAGENADGTWVLNVSDHAESDTGSVRAFSLDLGGTDCTSGD